MNEGKGEGKTEFLIIQISELGPKDGCCIVTLSHGGGEWHKYFSCNDLTSMLITSFLGRELLVLRLEGAVEMVPVDSRHDTVEALLPRHPL